MFALNPLHKSRHPGNTKLTCMEHLCFRFLEDGDNLAVPLCSFSEFISFGHHLGVFFKKSDDGRESESEVYGFKMKGVVITTLSEFVGTSKVLYRVTYEYEKKEPSLIKEKAKDVLENPEDYGFGEYILLNNNCQHFASYVTTGHRFSFETDKLYYGNKWPVT